MLDNIIISGFADEIDMNLDEQLRVVKELGMNYICIRAADGKGIADYTPEEFQEKILPRLKAAGVGVSSLGSPIGKIGIDDEQAYATQLKQLENLQVHPDVQLLDAQGQESRRLYRSGSGKAGRLRQSRREV